MKAIYSIALSILFFSCAAQQRSTGYDAFMLGDSTRVTFETICGDPQPGVQWVHVHENERTALETARAIIDSIGKGCIATWKCQGNRNVVFNLQGGHFQFDPNRIYTDEGLAATMKANGAYTNEAFEQIRNVAKRFTEFFVNGRRLVVAMHNNTDGGGLHIRSYLPDGEYANDAAEVNIEQTEDIDDFFYTTDKRIYEFLKAKHFNILLQNNATVTNDGSLSVYCGYQGIAYLNIEAQVGNLAQQKRMMVAVYEMINELFAK